LGDAGCGIRSSDQTSFGPPFNANSGGMYAMKLDDSGIKVWFFKNGAAPLDLSAGAPMPETWASPMAYFPFGNNCNASSFSAQTIIFDTTLW
jgi:hypothetical protein